MSYAPIQLLSTTLEDYAGWWVKFFEQGTVTPLSMATDADAGTLIAEAEISSGGTVPIGFFQTSAPALLNPFIDGDYDAWLFPTEAEAAANDTTNAIQVADNLNTFPGGINNSGVYTDKAEVAALSLTQTDAGRKIFIVSDDGGEFTVRYNATPGTYADNGGSYTGTEFIPSGGDGTIGIVRDYDGAIFGTWFGTDEAASDNVAFIQKAIDYADTDTRENIVDLQGMELVLNSTMYVGDSLIQNGVLAPLVDVNFSEGSGTRSNEGIILTKSAAGVSYGLSSVEPKFKDIHVKHTRTSVAAVNTINTVFLFENVDGGYRQNCSHETVSTVDIVNPWDMYANVKSFNIDNDTIDNTVGAFEGGCWIRNFDTTNATENIKVTNSIYTQDSLDEVIAIWVPSTATNAELKNVTLDNVDIISSGAPIALSVSADATGSAVNEVTLKNVNVTAISTDAITSIKVQRSTSNGTATKINIIGGTTDIAINNTSSAVFAIANEDDNNELTITNHKVFIRSATGTSNSVAAFKQCSLIDCANTWGFDIGATTFSNFRAFSNIWSVNGGHYNGVAAGGKSIANCDLNDTAIIDVEKLINVDINTSEYISDLFTYAGSFGSPDLVIIENVRLTENAATGAASTDDLFNLTTAGRYFIRGLHYIGVRRALGSSGSLRTERMDDVTLDNSTTIISTSKFGSGETPWGLFPGSETHILPEGHRMEASAPATATVVIYIKKAGASIGGASADWITVTSD